MSELGGATLFKSEAHTDFLQLRPKVDAARSNLRLVLDGLARELGKRQSGSLDQRGPRFIRAGACKQGDGGFRPRFTHWAKKSPTSYCCQRARSALGRVGTARRGCS